MSKPFDRRSFLMACAAGLPVGAALLAACGRPGERSIDDMSPEPEVPLARQDSPASLPVFSDISAIPDDLEPERGATLRVLEWFPSYIAPKVVALFEETYDCRIEPVPFRTIDQSLARLRTGDAEADVYFPTLKVLGSVAAAKLIQPLNPTYIPNRSHVWESLRDPFYDVGAAYTIPYFNWTIGMSWRSDLLETDPSGLDDPYDLFWDPRLRGKVHLLDSSQDLIVMAMLRGGGTDVNTEDPVALEMATEDLLDLVDAVAPGIDGTDYRDLYPGSTVLHQSWSGNLSYAKHYAHPPSKVKDLSYLWPPELGTGLPGAVGSDVGVVLAGAQNPVLGHLLLNFVLDPEMAYLNSVWNGYQAPNEGVTRERLVRDGAVPSNLRNIIVTEDDFKKGLQELQLSPAADAAWDAAYAEVVAAADRAREGL